MRLTRKKNIFLSIIAALACAAVFQSSHLAHADDIIKMGVRIVGLEDPSGKTMLSADSAKKLIQNVDQMYQHAGCAIQFQLDSFVAVDPRESDLEYDTSDMSELDRYRSAFDDGKSLLIVDTGPWGSSMHPANAWTAMPGDKTPMGSIFEASVADFYPIVAHELGHYLGLKHLSDSSNVMNPIIETFSTAITADQCGTMSQTARTALAFARR